MRKVMRRSARISGEVTAGCALPLPCAAGWPPPNPPSLADTSFGGQSDGITNRAAIATDRTILSADSRRSICPPRRPVDARLSCRSHSIRTVAKDSLSHSPGSRPSPVWTNALPCQVQPGADHGATRIDEDGRSSEVRAEQVIGGQALARVGRMVTAAWSAGVKAFRRVASRSSRSERQDHAGAQPQLRRPRAGGDADSVQRPVVGGRAHADAPREIHVDSPARRDGERRGVAVLATARLPDAAEHPKKHNGAGSVTLGKRWANQ